MLSRLSACFIMACALCVGPFTAAQADAAGKLVKHENFASTLVEPRQVTVWLPPGYESDSEPYAVLYMHDGQNLFEPGTSYGGKEWGVDEAITRLIAEGKLRKTIVVGVWNTPKRWLEYVPADMLNRLPEDLKATAAAMGGQNVLSDAYLRFLVEELKPFIDRTYRTRPGREDTAIMGSSMGGLISLYAAIKHPDVFGAAGCVSTHWPIASPDMRNGEHRRLAEALPEAMIALIADELKPGVRIYFDHGTINLDSYYEPYQKQVDAVMEKIGFKRGHDWETHKFEGADHNEVSWRERVDIPLTFLFGTSAH